MDFEKDARLAGGNGGDLERIRVVLVDDHDGTRNALSMLVDMQPDMHVVGDAGDGESVLDLIDEVNPQVIIMDVNLPGVDGIETTRCIRAAHPDVRVIGLTIYARRDVRRRMQEAGAETVIAKGGASADIMAAIRGS